MGRGRHHAQSAPTPFNRSCAYSRAIGGDEENASMASGPPPPVRPPHPGGARPEPVAPF